MWPVIIAVLQRSAPYVTLPFAVVIGFIGYNIESLYRKETPWKQKTIQEERDERKLDETNLEDVTKVKSLKTGIPKTVLDRNDPPKPSS